LVAASKASPMKPTSSGARILGVGVIGTTITVGFMIAPAIGAITVGAYATWYGALRIQSGRQQRLFLAAHRQAHTAAIRGDLQSAYDIFRRWAGSAQPPRVSAMARHNIAWVHIRRCELDLAIDLLLDNDDRNARALREIGLWSSSAADLGLVYALVGELPDAETWLAEAERREYDFLSAAPAIAFARAVLDCRTANSARAERSLDERWAEHEASSPGNNLRLMCVVRAFAIADAGPRESGRADAMLAKARPLAYPAEYDFLTVSWPEMAAFLEAHGF
jgi:hypothetical protein